MAPALTSDSKTRLLTLRRSTRRARSSSEANGPATSEASPRPSRAATIDSIAPSPTFLMAARPKRIASGAPDASASTVKSACEACTSGGRTAIPSRRHSATTAATFSARSRKPLRTAVMNSTG